MNAGGGPLAARDAAGAAPQLGPRPGDEARGHPLIAAWSGYGCVVARADRVAVHELEPLRIAAVAADGEARPRFARQDAALLADGLHYEVRIAGRGAVATREGNAHDLFNALAWLRHPRLKRALNARQAADVAEVGPKRRTRGQCALTHFDEAGAIVWLAGPGLLPAWDAHDWPALFRARRGAWGTAAAVTVFGHALAEHVWSGRGTPVAKAIAVSVAADALPRAGAGALLPAWPQAEARVAAAIADGRLLADPQELRPLPLAGLPGWHALGEVPDFFGHLPCFRPLRPGRRYPAAFDLSAAG